MFCRQQVAELAQHANQFDDKNARLAVIGTGDPRHFKAFREITGYQGFLFSDPSLNVFSLLGFSNRISGFISINSMFKAAAAIKNGHRQGSLQGSALQLGGAVVVDAGGIIRYFFKSKKAGDHPDIRELIEAVGDTPSLS